MESSTLNCGRNISAATLSAWRDADLPAAEMRSLTDHTATCAACQARLADFDAVARALLAQRELDPADRILTGVRARVTQQRAIRLSRAQLWSGLGALSSVAALVLLFVYVFGPALGNGAPRFAYTTYHLPDSSYSILDMVPSRDGGFWFSEAQIQLNNGSNNLGPGKIGHINTAAQISEYPLPPNDTFNFFSNATPQDAGALTVTPDGSVWFEKLAGGLVHTSLPKADIVRLTPNGSMTDYPMPFPSSQIFEPNVVSPLVLGADGNLWFMVAVASGSVSPSQKSPVIPTTTELARITPSGATEAFPFSGSTHQPSGPFSLTAGPDGNLWFFSAGGATAPAVIARATPSGVISTFALPGQNHTPVDLVSGQDGNLWFVDMSGGTDAGPGDAVGRITSAGQITEFPVTTPGIALVFDLAPARDGALYFTELGTGCPQHCDQVHSGIGRITPAGQITSYPLVNRPNFSLTNSVVAPDGSVYAVEQMSGAGGFPVGVDRLVRLTPSGHLSEYTAPTHTGGTFLFLAGASNTLWLIVSPALGQTGTSTILRITLPPN